MPRYRPALRIDGKATDTGGTVATTAATPSYNPPAQGSVETPEIDYLTSSLSRSAVTPTATIGVQIVAPVGTEPTSYSIEWCEDPAFPDAAKRGAESKSTYYRIDGLKTATLYYVRVLAVYRGVPSGWSDVRSATTLDDTTAPNAPTGTSATFVGAGDLVITYTPSASSNAKDTEIRIFTNSTDYVLLAIDYDATGRYVWTAAQNLAATSGVGDPSVYVELRTRSWSNYYSSAVAVGTTTKAVPATPSVSVDFTGVNAVFSLATGGDAATLRLAIDSTSAYKALGLVGSYTYTYDQNRLDHSGTASPSIVWRVVAVDGLGQVSGIATGTATNAPPDSLTAAGGSIAVYGNFNLDVFISQPVVPPDWKHNRIRVLQGTTVLYDQYKRDRILSLGGLSASTYTVEVTVIDAFDQASAAVTTGAAYMPLVTVSDVRAGATYTDSAGTAASTLNGLKDQDVATTVVTH